MHQMAVGSLALRQRTHGAFGAFLRDLEACSATYREGSVLATEPSSLPEAELLCKDV